MADMAQVERIPAETAISAFGGFDSWCNNAAVAIYGDTERSRWRTSAGSFDVNYWGMVQGTTVAAHHMKA